MDYCPYCHAYDEPCDCMKPCPCGSGKMKAECDCKDLFRAESMEEVEAKEWMENNRL